MKLETLNSVGTEFLTALTCAITRGHRKGPENLRALIFTFSRS
jgi:hypothetical protein